MQENLNFIKEELKELKIFLSKAKI